jgi:hypothetical protein
MMAEMIGIGPGQRYLTPQIGETYALRLLDEPSGWEVRLTDGGKLIVFARCVLRQILRQPAGLPLLRDLLDEVHLAGGRRIYPAIRILV